jgi:hypothetical protein
MHVRTSLSILPGERRLLRGPFDLHGVDSRNTLPGVPESSLVTWLLWIAEENTSKDWICFVGQVVAVAELRWLELKWSPR